MGQPLNLIGEKYGRLTVVERAENMGVQTAWRCVCDCGNKITVRTNSLRTGNTRSCGCLHQDSPDKHIIHGLCNHPLYSVWYGIKARCNNPSSMNYPRYGARGIKVCDAWENDFLTFYEWSIRSGWEHGLTIDRIDNDGDYCPENCRWVTHEVQNNNTRNNVNITYNGKTQTITQWANELGINESTLRKRISRGWDIDKALSTKVVKS